MAKKKAKKKSTKRKEINKDIVSITSAKSILAPLKKTKQKKKSTKKPSGKCFVLVPFRESFNAYYNSIIEPAVTKANLIPERGDSLFLPTPIMGDIWAMIQDAKVLLAILTGKNANVFYELGLGHAIGKPIVLVSETMEDVPFDLQALRVILYNKDDPKWGDKLRITITTSLVATFSEPTEAVPPMFRKKVKSQAPEESEITIRLSALERSVQSLQAKSFPATFSSSHSSSSSELLKSLSLRNEIIEKLNSKRILDVKGLTNFIRNSLEKDYSATQIHNTLSEFMTEEFIKRAFSLL